VDAAQLIDAMPMFDDLPEEILDDLAGRVRRKTASAGGSIVRQGDVADAFYIVRKGVLHVVQEDPSTGDEQIVRVLGRGDAFGELGLVRSAPRAATVRSSTHSQVFEIDKGTFERLLADTIHIPQFGPSLQAMAELKAIPAFSHLELDQLEELLKFGEWVNIGPHHAIFKQGEPGDAFYAIRSGQAEVVRDRRVVQSLGPGDHFGELALLRKAPRAATVRTVTPVRAYRVDPRGFNRLVRKAFKRGALAAPELNRTWQH
jgi:CRP-like cAMP-binding protein